jgi:NAD(P)-dependent dehydrogenase (short-subunit alcohol dehydrogenase family)
MTSAAVPERAKNQAIRFDGQVIVVTGAGRGLGAAYARLFAARGGSVVVHDAGVTQDGSGFDPSVADAVVAEITAAGGIAVACYENLELPPACARVVEFAMASFGRLDALVRNASLVVFASLKTLPRKCGIAWSRSASMRRSILLAPLFLICDVRAMGASSSPLPTEP